MYLHFATFSLKAFNNLIFYLDQLLALRVFSGQPVNLIFKSLDLGLEFLKETLVISQFVGIQVIFLDGNRKHFPFSGLEPFQVDVMLLFQ